MKVNYYNKDMAYADSEEMKNKTNSFMRRKLNFFWTIEKITSVKTKKLQFLGADKIINVVGQAPLIVEEKIRRITRNDILIELIADDRYYLKAHRGTGWGLKEYSSDLLLYYFEDTDTGHIFSWKKFQKTLLKNLPIWYPLAQKRKFGYNLIRAKNVNYSSLNIAIPMKDFLEAYKKSGGIII